MLRTLLERAESTHRTGRRLVILHFNDVYDVSEDRAARFVSTVRSFADREPLILFSGDCYSPSLMSVITKGSQMPPILNAIGVQVACFGNHVRFGNRLPAPRNPSTVCCCCVLTGVRLGAPAL